MLITSDGNHLLKPNIKGYNAATSIVHISGTFSTATGHLAYLDELGNYIPFTGATLVVDTQITVTHGIGVAVYAIVSSSDGSTNIAIKLASKS